jgi:hypothetical protein
MYHGYQIGLDGRIEKWFQELIPPKRNYLNWKKENF